MTTKMTAALGALALTLTTASAVLAQDIHQISIVNGYAAPVEIYAEDAGGGLHALTRLKAGEVKTLEADVRTVGWNRARLHVRPTDGADWLSTWGDRGIVTDTEPGMGRCFSELRKIPRDDLEFACHDRPGEVVYLAISVPRNSLQSGSSTPLTNLWLSSAP